MAAYYNEFDPYAAQWLRNLIEAGHIAPGFVDERSIEDVKPSDLAGFTQCHFFAGVGVWSLALRRVGWPDDVPVWTGSCPCQPFSAAGAGAGFADARHLWPSFAWLIKQCKPAVVFGEQVASKAVEPWVDLVHADLEAMEYAFGAVPFPSAGVGAPHIRDRLFWVAESGSKRREWRKGPETRSIPYRDDARRLKGDDGLTCADEACLRLAHADGGDTGAEREQCSGQQRQQPENGSRLCGMAYPGSAGSSEQCWRRHESQGSTSSNDTVRMAEPNSERRDGFDPLLQWEKSRRISGASLEASGRGPVNGFWRCADWISCRDDRFRPVEPGTFPLVASTPAKLGSLRAGWHAPAGKENQGHRAGRLRAYGNAINAKAAEEFIAAYLESV